MHNFLHSIGFSEVKTKKAVDLILQEVLQSWDEKKVVEEEDGHIFAEISKEYGNGIGITICGEYDENDDFQMEYYYPYYKGESLSSYEDIIIERHAARESFAGACEDVRVGVSLIFYLLNAGEYLEKKITGELERARTALCLSGLGESGKILLPIQKDQEQRERERKYGIKRNNMIIAARNGDEEAMESLTIEDMDTFSKVTKRIQTEDMFSIVDSYFMPYGVECDQYYLLGEIVESNVCRNTRTQEKIYQLTLMCNDMMLDVCINEKDLLGEPMVGRRFKGAVLMQGIVQF